MQRSITRHSITRLSLLLVGLGGFAVASAQTVGNQKYTMSMAEAKQLNIQRCERNNEHPSTLIKHDCNCIGQEAERQYAQAILPESSFKMGSLDTRACIDPQKTIPLMIKARNTPAQARILNNANIDVEDLWACHEKALWNMPPAELADADATRTALRTCKPKLRKP